MTSATVNAISARLSLRPPQHESLDILARVTDLISLDKGSDPAAALAAIRGEFPSVEDFERDFPSVCFALATGVGKTRLMGAFIAYLYAARNMKHFFVLAPSLTIYDKLIRDFTPGTPKYVFQGIADFAAEPPEIITGDNYESGRGVRSRDLFGATNAHINVFNISKINTEVRGGRSPRIKRLSEYIGESYFDYLASLEDLVLLMDESHRYRGAAGFRAISELKPVLGLELTATPQIESASGPIPFRNVIYSYPLANAMADGFVKEPAVATRENFRPEDYDKPQLQELKLRDGIVLHENVKAEWQAYSRNTGLPLVKPFVLVVAENTDHANALVELIRSDQFFDGYYRDRVITVHSRQSGQEEDANVARLLAVESVDEPTEIVVHVNKLKEGWDVTNLYTIVPLRAARVRTLVEQTIGRGLRLPYGGRTGVQALDTLTIVAHDEFDEIVAEANRPGSIIRRGVKIGRDIPSERKTVVTVAPFIEQSIAAQQGNVVFATPEEREVAMAALDIMEREPWIPEIGGLSSERNRARITQRIADRAPGQAALDLFRNAPRIESIVARTTRLYEDMTIAIPRIIVVPRGQVRVGYRDFDLELLGLARLQPVPENVLLQSLRTNERRSIFADQHLFAEGRPEDYLVRALIDFDDIDYDRDSDLLYKLAGQLVAHLKAYLHTDGDLHNVLQYHQRYLADLIHSQLDEHWWEDAPAGYEAHTGRGFHILKSSSFTIASDESVRDFREPVAQRQLIRGMLFGGFQRCLYPQQKFDSDSERRFAVICDDSPIVQKWFKPAPSFFRIDYKHGVAYEPDFIIETTEAKILCEPKRASEMDDDIVRLKSTAATEWCRYATEYEAQNEGKPWRYALIPHDAITSTATFGGLLNQFARA